jgi:hypothetical protein
MFYTPALNSNGRKPTGAKLALKPFHVWGIRVRLQVGGARPRSGPLRPGSRQQAARLRPRSAPSVEPDLRQRR